MNQISKSSFFIEFDSFLFGNFPSQTYARAYIYEAPIPYLEIALNGLKKFPNDDPVLYQNVAATVFEMGWRKEVIKVLKKGGEKFLGDEELKKFLKNVEDNMDALDKGDKPPILGLILLITLLHKKMRKK